MAVIVFYTIHDPTVVARNCRLTQSDMYRIYAEQVAGPGAAAHGVATDTEALARIRAVPAGTLNRALFVGHGLGDGGGGYLFRQRAAGDGLFDQNDTALMDALGRALVANGGRVEFHACNLVGTQFMIVLQQRLSNFAIGNIYAYQGRMFMRPEVNAQCQITGWTNRVVAGGTVLSGGPGIVTPQYFTSYPFYTGPVSNRPRP